MKHILIRIGIHAVAIYAALCLILFFAQRSLIYFPTKADRFQMNTVSILKVQDASLQISVGPCDGQDALIYFGGNAEEVSGSLRMFSAAFPKHAIYLMHYRGYDGSSGKPTEADLHSDAQALYDLVRTRHNKIVVVGRSLGSGVAIRLAASNSVNHLVLVTPYDSLLNIAKQTYSFIPVRLILKDRFESWRYAPLVKAPTILIAAETDGVIPRESNLSLFHSFPSGIAKIQFIPRATHNSITELPGFVQALQGGH